MKRFRLRKEDAGLRFRTDLALAETIPGLARELAAEKADHIGC
jgi:hypothetical protein